MGQAFYRKYRSRSLDDVVGQDHIVKTLKSALKSGRLSHAYLFTGPRGVGKTSVARILAHEVNGLKYNDEIMNLDIIEIDAASNRRIDEIRDLRERVRVAPAAAKYKVYIIDEVHMLTREAFNALLKTLEEPPSHIIFILATTEAHKLPETIISRTQRFEFRPINKAQAAKHLADIAKREKIIVSDEALELLAEFGEGSFRDSIGYLDQLSSVGESISGDDVRTFLGLPKAQSIDELLDIIAGSDSAKLLKKLVEIEEQGISPVSLAAALSGRLRSRALENKINHRQIGLLKDLSQVSASSRPQEALEISLMTAVSQSMPVQDDRVTRPRTFGSSVKAETIVRRVESKGDFNLDQWDDVLDKAKAEAASIYTALRLAEPAFSNGVLTLRFQFPLHQKKLAQLKNQELVARVIRHVCQAEVSVRSVLKEDEPHNDIDNDLEPEAVSTINNIFGNSEVLEA